MASGMKNIRRVGWIILIVLLAAGISIWHEGGSKPGVADAPSGPAGTNAQQATASPDATAWATAATPLPPVVIPNESFQLRPFAAAITNRLHAWTEEDGCDTNVIRQLAHNNLEYDRLVNENARIKRRQLVYRNDPVAAIIERSKLTGEPISRLTLPALDGQEIEFDVENTDMKPSGMQGMIAGRIPNQPGSMVVLAFVGGRESYTIFSPADDLYIDADPREPGEVLVKSIDPAVYIGDWKCGNPECTLPHNGETHHEI